MNQHKYLIPVVVGLLGLSVFCFVLSTAFEPKPVEAETSVVSSEVLEETDALESEQISTEPLMAVELPVFTKVAVPAVSSTDEDVDSFDYDPAADVTESYDPVFLDTDLECQQESAWEGEEIVDPFEVLDHAYAFWNETVEYPGGTLPDFVVVPEDELVVEYYDDFEVSAFTENDELITDYSSVEEGPSPCDDSFEGSVVPLDEPVVAPGVSFSEEEALEFYQDLVSSLGQVDTETYSEEEEVFEIESVGTLVDDSFEAPSIETFEIDFETTFTADLKAVEEELLTSDESFGESFEIATDVVLVVDEPSVESFEVTTVDVEVLTGADSEVVEESSVANLLAEENRIADLRRYSVDDIYRSNWKRALDEIRELVTLRPYHADYHMTLGLVHRRLEDVIQDGSHLQEAMRKYEEYSEFGGEEAIASLLLAEAHAVNNDRPRAFEFLERAASNGMNIARAVQQFPLLEKYTRDTRFVRTALRLERYTLATVVSRDPFTGPWRIGTEQDETIFIGPFTKQQQQQFLATAREAMARVEYALRNRDEVAAMEAYGQIEEISSTVARFDQPELAGELRSIMERLDEVEDGIEQIRVTYLYEQARSKMASMKKSFEEQDFVMVDRLHGEVCSMAFSIEELGNSYSTAATLVVQAADQLQQRSNIVREFLAKNVTVAGVVVAPEGSHAIIDGHWVPEGGDVFEGRLDQILRDRVVILYKGERIIQKFSRF